MKLDRSEAKELRLLLKKVSMIRWDNIKHVPDEDIQKIHDLCDWIELKLVIDDSVPDLDSPEAKDEMAEIKQRIEKIQNL